MASIPAEILIAIVRHVHQQNKLQCMLVCRQWKTTIESCVLFETLNISSVEGLNSVKARVEREPSYGTQVKRLLFKVNPPRNFNMAVLPMLFPNVVDVYVTPSIYIQDNSFEPWHSRLEHYFGGNSGSIIVMLGSKVWSNLTSLELRATDFRISTRTYLNALVNTPAVKHLILGGSSFSVDNFEFIHDTLPELQSLAIEGFTYVDENPPNNIAPTSSVTSLSLTAVFVTGISFTKMLFSYILQKYPNLSELSIGIGIFLSGSNHNPDTDFLHNKWDDLLTHLAPHLRKLDISLQSRHEYEYVLRALDRCNCQINSLTLDDNVDQQVVNILVQSNQSRHIKSLRLVGWPRNVCRRLNDMTMLTQLELYFNSYTRHLGTSFNDLVTICGENLESLKIRNVTVFFNKMRKKFKSMRIDFQVVGKYFQINEKRENNY